MGAPSPAKKKINVKDVTAKATALTKTVRICVAGELSGEHERLNAELEAALRDTAVTDARLGGSKDAAQVELAERIRELESEMDDSTFAFKFRAVKSKAWSDLLAEHPDPKRERLFNAETFIPAAIAACCIEPEGFDDPEAVAELFDALSAGQQGELFEAAWEVNQGGPLGVKSSLASAVLQASETSSPTA